MLAAIRALLERGGVVAGTSAGLAVQQGTDMVSGGADIHNAWKHGAHSGYDLEIDGHDALTAVPAGGFGFFPEGLLDSHFTEWARPARAIRLATALGHPRVIGVDEHTALIYDRTHRTAEVVGSRGVSFIDCGATECSADSVLGARWSYLVAGDRHNFVNNTTSRGTHTADLELTAEALAQAENNVWADDGSRPLLALAQHLLVSAELSSSGDSAADRFPQYRTTLRRDERTVSLASGGFADLIVSITPTPTQPTRS